MGDPPDGDRLSAALSALGVRPGDVLLVHASLRSVGPVQGGPTAVLAALRRTVGPEGTVVVPTFTPENSDTSPHYRARVRGLDSEAREAVRASMEPFDPARTPAPSMGALAETVRTAVGAERSGHPQTSFAAIGPGAGKLLAGHRPDCHLGEDSPLARLYEADARILLLGTGYDTCTAFHLGEYRSPGPPLRHYRCVVAPRGVRRWWEYEDVALDDGDFAALGAAFEETAADGGLRAGRVGAAECRLVRLRPAVDFATAWLTEHRAAVR
ncbi:MULTISPECIES: AAC(3) family N-acetyltransferase [Streptomyces]|uniref:aminoglycoside N(3)-acetyltransferase n=1 Tax=Streptomyces TaxID=1883 RepID=UPI0004CB47CC|nr:MULTISPECIES: AAC(3) family N-acetyltransferase [Streptomyces]RPK81577.1 SPBc2 prophage-derived aminoglycoside N(3')-acetyltransferase-like protein YokD [Streptomyces sp. ADI98-10]